MSLQDPTTAPVGGDQTDATLPESDIPEEFADQTIVDLTPYTTYPEQSFSGQPFFLPSSMVGAVSGAVAEAEQTAPSVDATTIAPPEAAAEVIPPSPLDLPKQFVDYRLQPVISPEDVQEAGALKDFLEALADPQNRYQHPQIAGCTLVDVTKIDLERLNVSEIAKYASNRARQDSTMDPRQRATLLALADQLETALQGTVGSLGKATEEAPPIQHFFWALQRAISGELHVQGFDEHYRLKMEYHPAEGGRPFLAISDNLLEFMQQNWLKPEVTEQLKVFTHPVFHNDPTTHPTAYHALRVLLQNTAGRWQEAQEGLAILPLVGVEKPQELLGGIKDIMHQEMKMRGWTAAMPQISLIPLQQGVYALAAPTEVAQHILSQVGAPYEAPKIPENALSQGKRPFPYAGQERTIGFSRPSTRPTGHADRITAESRSGMELA